jgi:hypothetical protein
MAGLLTIVRSAIVQAEFNGRMADFVAKELAVLSLIGAIGLGFLFSWQWFFWGIILCPVFLSMCMFIHFLRRLIISFIALLWALPLIIAGRLGIDAAYLGAVIAFLYCFWVHHKALTWYTDLERNDDDTRW